MKNFNNISSNEESQSSGVTGWEDVAIYTAEEIKPKTVYESMKDKGLDEKLLKIVKNGGYDSLFNALEGEEREKLLDSIEVSKDGKRFSYEYIEEIAKYRAWNGRFVVGAIRNRNEGQLFDNGVVNITSEYAEVKDFSPGYDDYEKETTVVVEESSNKYGRNGDKLEFMMRLYTNRYENSASVKFKPDSWYMDSEIQRTKRNHWDTLRVMRRIDENTAKYYPGNGRSAVVRFNDSDEYSRREMYYGGSTSIEWED